MFAVIIWILSAFACAFIAGIKQRSAWWALAGLLLGPIGVIVVALLPKVEADPEQPGSGVKRCPFCAEVVLAEAIKCKHCGSELPKPEAVITEHWADQLAKANRSARRSS